MSAWRDIASAPITLPGGRPAYWMMIWWSGRCMIACREASGAWTTYSGERLIAPEPVCWMPLPVAPDVAQPPDGDATEALRYNEDALGELAIDFLEERADEWMSDGDVQRMFNAIASVFEKHAPQEIMDRFREKLGVIGRQCFVEGALRSWAEIAAQQRALGQPLPSLAAIKADKP